MFSGGTELNLWAVIKPTEATAINLEFSLVICQIPCLPFLFVSFHHELSNKANTL